MKIKNLETSALLDNTIDYYRRNNLNFQPNNKKKEFLAIEFEGEIIGFIGYNYKKWAEIIQLDIFLLPQFIGRKFSFEALTLAEEFLKAKYPNLIAFTAEVVSPASVALFTKAGYLNDPADWYETNEYYKLIK